MQRADTILKKTDEALRLPKKRTLIAAFLMSTCIVMIIISVVDYIFNHVRSELVSLMMSIFSYFTTSLACSLAIIYINL